MTPAGFTVKKQHWGVMRRRYLNIGCGQAVHPEWVNADFRAGPGGIIAIDARNALPFGDAELDAVYHSHLLEHLSRSEGERFLGECYRVLKHGGVLRVVVPDFENLVVAYLKLRDEMLDRPNEDTYEKYHWLFIELVDQFARNAPGGEMASFLAGDVNSALDEFLLRRVGFRRHPPLLGGAVWHATHVDLLRIFVAKLRPSNLREHLLKRILGRADYESLRIGRFRNSGELHRWLYDRPSLDYLLRRTGFMEVVQRSPEESGIEGWSDFRLDIDGEGLPRKASSLYLEAVK